MITQLRGVLDALQVANTAQRDAIEAALAAHAAAERLRGSDTH